MSQNDIVDRVQYLQELRRMSEELTAEIDRVQTEIKIHMADHSLTELVAGAFKVTWQTVVSARLDGRALARDFPNLVEKYTRHISTRRFQVR